MDARTLPRESLTDNNDRSSVEVDRFKDLPDCPPSRSRRETARDRTIVSRKPEQFCQCRITNKALFIHCRRLDHSIIGSGKYGECSINSLNGVLWSATHEQSSFP